VSSGNTKPDAKNISVAQRTEWLGNRLHKIVIDDTGLTGDSAEKPGENQLPPKPGHSHRKYPQLIQSESLSRPKPPKDNRKSLLPLLPSRRKALPMSSPAQLAANLLNAQLSTGPVTLTGKEKSARNNLRHGFRSQTVLLPGDDPAEYLALLTDLTDHFAPRDLTEQRFIREMADAEWRLRRVRQHHESALTRHIATLAERHPAADPLELQSMAIESLAETGTSYATWLRYESKFERQYQNAQRDWRAYQQVLAKSESAAQTKVLEKALNAPLPTLVPTATAPTLASNVQTPRNSPCPCGSPQKYKRCCGQNAPPVLGMAA
jgi:hypothetical protein